MADQRSEQPIDGSPKRLGYSLSTQVIFAAMSPGMASLSLEMVKFVPSIMLDGNVQDLALSVDISLTFDIHGFKGVIINLPRTPAAHEPEMSSRLCTRIIGVWGFTMDLYAMLSLAKPAHIPTCTIRVCRGINPTYSN